jgi:hypothetical protein
VLLPKPVEEHVERPADPEVFLDVLDGCAQSTSSRQEHIPALVVTGSDHMAERIVHERREAAILLAAGFADTRACRLRPGVTG